MKGLAKLGEYMLEIVVVILLSVVSVLSIVLYIPLIIGLTDYFSRSKDERLFRDIFRAIKENIKIVIPYTIFQLLMIVFPTLNIFYFNTHIENLNPFFLGISYVVLIIGLIYLVTAPTIIVNMNVSFMQLLRNSFMLLFGSVTRSITSLAIAAITIAAILKAPYIVIVLMYVVPLVNTRILKENFLILKAKALHTSVYELKKQNNDDIEIDENDEEKAQ